MVYVSINNFNFTFLLITESQHLLFSCLFLISASCEVSFSFGHYDVISYDVLGFYFDLKKLIFKSI